MSKLPPPPPFDNDEDDDDLDNEEDDANDLDNSRNDGVSEDDDESVDLLAPTQDINLLTFTQDFDASSPDLLVPTQDVAVGMSGVFAPTQHFDASSQDLLAPTQDVAVGTPIKDVDRLSETLHPLTVRAPLSIASRMTSPVRNPYLTMLRSSSFPALGNNDITRRDRQSQSVRFELGNDRPNCEEVGEEGVGAGDDVHESYNGEYDEHASAMEHGLSSDDDNGLDHDVRSDDDAGGTEVPGTAYDVISSAARREAIRHQLPLSSLGDIDPRFERWIRLVLWDDWGIQFPHDWQIRAIHVIAFSRDTSTFLIAKTGSGKSAVPLTVGSLLTGITLTMVPLVGLGSDQVNKCSNDVNYIEGYHLDEHRGSDARLLRDRLISLNEDEAEYVSVFLYASPQSLQVGKFWYKTLMNLASKNLIRLIVVDEAHTVAQDGRDFRPES